ncbi:MAG: hypothetical protein K6E50_07885 [Lachnospiraceae bacterium]|nr:hypothetical protein [Lachnospiraceae bacterium]
MKKHVFFRVLVLILAVCLAGCGKPKSAKSLASAAKSQYGACTVVSKTQTANGSRVTLRDKLQGFEYHAWSGMDELYIDGSSFGSLPSNGDDFKISLINHVIGLHREELDDVCDDHGATFRAPEKQDDMIVIMASSLKEGEAAACECAEILQQENLESRLDGLLIIVTGNADPDWLRNERYGSVCLPDTSWRTPEDEERDFYIGRARSQTDPKAVYLRTEKGVFRDTGADLGQVVNTLGSDYPEKADDPVTFYYFRSSSGNEYYVCDFMIYDEQYDMRYFTNYKE